MPAAQSREGKPRGKIVPPCESILDLLEDRFGLLLISVRDQPARALRYPEAHEEDDEAENGADEKRHAPARIGCEQRGIEQDDRARRSDRRSDPEASVDDEIGPSAIARGNELLDGRVDRRVLAADARAGEEAERGEAPNVPREGGRRRRHQVDAERDEEQLLASRAIREPAEDRRTQNRAKKIGAARKTDIGIAELQDGTFPERTRNRSGQRDLEPVQDPGHAQRHHDQRVEPPPRQAIQPRGNIGFDNGIGAGLRRLLP